MVIRFLIIGAWLLLGLGLAPWPLAAGAAPLAAAPVYLPLVVDGPLTPTPAYAIDVLNLVNQERANAGCGPVALNPLLNTAALAHSQDMAHNDFFSHTGSNGSAPWDRMTAVGYTWSAAAENIAAGYTTAAGVMAGWMGSSGHRANILDCDFTEMGVGYYYLASDPGAEQWHHYWTQDFGRP